MSWLISWLAEDPDASLLETSDPAEIAAAFHAVGCRFERREVRPDVTAEAKPDEVLAAYQDLVDAEIAEHGFVTVDVAGIAPGTDPAYTERAVTVRGTFIREHTHGDDDEVRFITRGSGVFYLHIGDRVHALLAEAGDLTGVPRGTTHWFDTGARPDFTAIRFFHDPRGWVGIPTGSSINTRFPDADVLRARAS
jgi:1,2-dihydroxy-3-keto-5-methylthiopentene dioxygenase